MASLLQAAHAFIGRSEDEVRQALGPGATFESDDEYQSLDGLTSLEDHDSFPGATIYLLDGQAELVYLSGPALEGITASAIEAEVKGRPAQRRSRAGKTASTFIHADDGVAYSATGDTVHFIEVFRPRTLAEYESEIYQEPPAFIR